MELFTPPLNLLALIQTEPAPVLFQIHTDLNRQGVIWNDEVPPPSGLLRALDFLSSVLRRCQRCDRTTSQFFL